MIHYPPFPLPARPITNPVQTPAPRPPLGNGAGPRAW